METFEFDGEFYNDDRLFVLYLSKCSIKEDSETITTTIYHKVAPEDHLWCVTMYRNVARYRPYKVFHFENKIEAKAFIRETEPLSPLISLQGKSPPENLVLSYEDYLAWKKANRFQDYNYKDMFPDLGFMVSNPEEKFCFPK